MWMLIASLTIYVAMIIITGLLLTTQYTRRNGEDMDSEHITVALVLALLWPITITALIVFIIITEVRKGTR